MESLVIRAVSLDSALGFCASLSPFEVRLVESGDGSYHVEIPLYGDDRQTVTALDALEAYVSMRADGPGGD